MQLNKQLKLLKNDTYQHDGNEIYDEPFLVWAYGLNDL